MVGASVGSSPRVTLINNYELLARALRRTNAYIRIVSGAGQ